MDTFQPLIIEILNILTPWTFISLMLCLVRNHPCRIHIRSGDRSLLIEFFNIEKSNPDDVTGEDEQDEPPLDNPKS